MKAVVLARGKGTRMQQPDAFSALDAAQAQAADAGLKALMPFRRPFLDYVLSALGDAGCMAVCLIVGPGSDLVREYYTRHPPRRTQITFAVQGEPLGTAHALLSAEPFAGADPFLALNADNYYPPAVFRALRALDGPGLPAFRRSTLIHKSNIDVERIRAFAIVRIDREGFLEDVIEKPDQATYAAEGDDFYVSMNCWRFGPSIFTACRSIEPSGRGELELPNAVRYAVRTMGERFRAVPVDEGVLDLSRRADVAEVGRRLAEIEPDP